MNFAFLWTLTLLSGGIFAWLVAQEKINPTRDFFFVMVYLQMFIYLHLAPTLWISRVSSEWHLYYNYIQALCFVCFEIFFVFLYLLFIRRAAPETKHPSAVLVISGTRQTVLALLSLALTGAFLFVALREDIFLTRVGMVDTTNLQFSLSTSSFVIFRYFQFAAPFLMALSLAGLLYAGTGFRNGTAAQKFSWLAFVAITFVFVANQAANSRLRAIASVAMLVGIFLNFGKVRALSKRGVVLSLLGLLMASYFYQVAMNIRRTYADQGLKIEIFQPFVWHGAQDENDDLRFRLNGIDLMARMTPIANRDGFALGRAWEGPIVGTFAMFLEPSLVERYKQTYMVTPKRYLMAEYTTLGSPDYPSSILTDMYGNFGPVGLPLSAIMLAFVCSKITTAFVRQNSEKLLAVSFFVIFPVLLFEQETATFITSLVKTLPFLFVAFWLANPFVKSTASNSPILSHSSKFTAHST